MHLAGRAVVTLAVAALAVAGGVVGAQLLREARSQVAAQPASVAAARATPAAPVAAVVTRDQAIALVRTLGEVVRVDRIEAKLMPWSEFAPSMGVDRTGKKTPLPDAVWAVAVAGDTYPTTWGAPLGTPQQHFAWSLWGVDAVRLNIASLSVGTGGSWPPAFDGFVDHAAVVPTPVPAPTPFVPQGKVIPWSGLRATPTPAPTPPRAPAGIRPCASDDLVARFTGWGAAMGSDGPLYGAVRLGNRSSSSCWLRGMPTVRLLTANGEISTVTPPVQYEAGTGPDLFAYALLPANTPDPERVAWVTVYWSNWCDAAVRPVALVVRTAQQTEIRVAVNGVERTDGQAARMPACDDSGGPPRLGAGGFEFYGPSATPTPWVDRGTLEVIVDQPLRGRPGEIIRYRATLRNIGTIAVIFDECPVFTQNIHAGTPDPQGSRWILPCAGAARIDPSGSATFDMEFEIPRDAHVGRHTLLWGLQAPGVSGAIEKFWLEVVAP